MLIIYEEVVVTYLGRAVSGNVLVRGGGQECVGGGGKGHRSVRKRLRRGIGRVL
jgi:hypothetical protein